MCRQIIFRWVFILLSFTSSIYAQWIQQNSTINHSLHHVFAVDSATCYCSGASGTLLKTINSGNTWAQLSPFNYFPINSIFFINDEKGWAVGANSKIFKSTDGGEVWIDQSISPGSYLLYSVFFINEDMGWITGKKFNSYDNACILKTTDGGESWYEQFVGDFFSPVFYSIQFLNSENGWVVGSHGKVMKSTNGGTDWSYSQTGYTFEYCSLSFINDSTGWIIGSDYYSGPGGGYPFGTIFFTNNAGTTWEYQAEITYSIFNQVSATNFENVFIVGSMSILGEYKGVIFFTTNTGNNWSYQILDESSELFSVSFADSLNGWICGSEGVILHTTNGGVTSIDESVFTFRPAKFLLSQNYPNPFNPMTKIKYSIPSLRTQRAVSIQLKVYDVLGKEVATLVNEEKPPGEYEVQFIGSNLPSGIYFYQLKAGSFVETKKMVLIK